MIGPTALRAIAAAPRLAQRLATPRWSAPALTTCSRSNGSSAANALVLLAGRNRPGIVHALCAKALAPVNATTTHTRMAALAQDFCVMSQVSLKGSELGALRASLEKQFPDFSVRVKLLEGTSAAARARLAGGVSVQRYRLRVVGPDELGLLARVTLILAANNCNILDLESRNRPGSHISYETADMRLIFTSPSAHIVDEVRQKVADLGEVLGLETEVVVWD